MSTIHEQTPPGFVLSFHGDMLLQLRVYRRSKTSNGYSWAYSEDARTFSKCLDSAGKTKFALCAVCPNMENGNFEFFAKHGLSTRTRFDPLTRIPARRIRTRSVVAGTPFTGPACSATDPIFTPGG